MKQTRPQHESLNMNDFIEQQQCDEFIDDRPSEADWADYMRHLDEEEFVYHDFSDIVIEDISAESE